MGDGIITPIDKGHVALDDGEFADDTLLFAAADTFVVGTLLARKLLSDTIAVTPDGGNTGDHALVATPSAGRTLKVGTYVLTAGDLTGGVGEWTLTDPDGKTETFTTGAATDDLSFPDLGVEVAVTAVSTAFDDGDTADLVVSAQSGTPLVPFSPTGTNGAQKPRAVLTYEVTRASQGSSPVRAMFRGTVNKNRLIIDEDGDGDNITPAIVDELRANGINAVAVSQLSKLDNQ